MWETQPFDKRRMYCKIGMSLSQEMIRRCNTVPVGDVIALLRHIKAQFYRNTTVTKNSLKASLIHCRLEDYRDIEGLMVFITNTTLRLQSLGYETKEEDRIFFLLQALPSDYSAVKATIKLPREPELTWDQVCAMLRDTAEDPNIPGTISKSKKRSDGVFNSSTRSHSQGSGNRSKGNPNSSIICRRSAFGKCPLTKCKFKHVSRPTTPGTSPWANQQGPGQGPGQTQLTRSNQQCTFCKKPGHVEAHASRRRTWKTNLLTLLPSSLHQMGGPSMAWGCQTRPPHRGRFSRLHQQRIPNTAQLTCTASSMLRKFQISV